MYRNPKFPQTAEQKFLVYVDLLREIEKIDAVVWTVKRVSDVKLK